VLSKHNKKDLQEAFSLLLEKITASMIALVIIVLCK